MTRKLFIAGLVVSILMALGFWQVHRAVWKHDLVTIITERQAAAPLTALDTTSQTPLDNAYRRIVLTGTLNRAATYDLIPRTYNGRTGRELVAPMTVPTSATTGMVVLVDLGWVPDDYVVPAGAGATIETLSGTLLSPPERNMFTLANPLHTGKLYWIDPQFVASDLNVPVYPLVLYADQLGEAPPIGGRFNLDMPQNHVKYAVFWFAMAAIAAGMFARAIATGAKKDDQPAS